MVSCEAAFVADTNGGDVIVSCELGAGLPVIGCEVMVSCEADCDVILSCAVGGIVAADVTCAFCDVSVSCALADDESN